MRIKLWTYTAIATSFLQFSVLSARAESPTLLSQGVDLIVTSLETLTPPAPSTEQEAAQTQPATVEDVMKQIILGLRAAPFNECKNPLTQTVTECLRGNSENGYQGKIENYLNAGVKNGKIDIVERALLTRLFSAVTDVSDTNVTIASTPEMPEPSGKGLSQPSLSAYRQNKFDYSALRVAKGMEAVLPADLEAQMAKAFPRKMNGVGNITAEEFFASLPGGFGRLQLNLLAQQMIIATNLMTRPDSEIISYPADYAFTSKALKSLQDQKANVVNEISTATDPAMIKQYQTLLATLLAQETALQQKDPIDALTTQRGQLTAELTADETKVASCTPTDADCAAAISDVKAKRDAITSINTQLGTLVTTNELAPTDVQRFAVNQLRQNLNTLNQNPPFAGLNLLIGDVLMASWISGDISSDSLQALAQMSNLKETHTSLWKKILSVTWGVAQPVLMAVPTTSYIAIGVGIFLQIKQESATQNAQKSEAPQLIPSGSN